MNFAPNRVVAFLTPLVFAPAAGWIVAWVARHVPGAPPLDTTEVTAVFIAGATIAFGKAALWMHGWQIHMQLPDPQLVAQQPAVQQPQPSGGAQAQPTSSPNGTAPELEPV